MRKPLASLLAALFVAGCASPPDAPGEGGEDAVRLDLVASTLAVGHLDMDAWLDLALAGPEGVDLRRGTGPATWAEPERLCACRASALVLGDVDGDGRGDVGVVDAGATRFFWGDANGFVEAALPPSPASPPLALVDVDNDGRLDLVLARTWARNAGDRSFEEVRALPGQGDSPLAFVLVDDDMLLDLVVATPGGVQLHLNDPTANGTFEARGPPVDAGVGDVASLVPADVDGDQRVDVIVAGSRGVRVLRNDGTLVPDAFHPGEARGAAAADLDNDGLLEILAFDGRGAWIAGGARLAAPSAAWSAMAIADVDRSGAPDVVLFARGEQAAWVKGPLASGHHLTIRPLGNESNADGVGLKATLATGTRLLLRQVGGAASPAVALPNEAHFGLGATAAASYNLALLWPSGILQFDKANASLVVDRRIDARESTSEAPWDTC